MLRENNFIEGLTIKLIQASLVAFCQAAKDEREFSLGDIQVSIQVRHNW